MLSRFAEFSLEELNLLHLVFRPFATISKSYDLFVQMEITERDTKP